MNIVCMSESGKKRLYDTITKHCRNSENHKFTEWENDVVNNTTECVDVKYEFNHSYEISQRYTKNKTVEWFNVDESDFVLEESFLEIGCTYVEKDSNGVPCGSLYKYVGIETLIMGDVAKSFHKFQGLEFDCEDDVQNYSTDNNDQFFKDIFYKQKGQ